MRRTQENEGLPPLYIAGHEGASASAPPSVSGSHDKAIGGTPPKRVYPVASTPLTAGLCYSLGATCGDPAIDETAAAYRAALILQIDVGMPGFEHKFE